MISNKHPNFIPQLTRKIRTMARVSIQQKNKI